MNSTCTSTKKASAEEISKRLCAFVLRTEQRCPIRCVSEAEADSVYCPVHRNGTQPAERSRGRVKRDLDLDVMPWSQEDRRIFAKIEAGRRAKPAGKRR